MVEIIGMNGERVTLRFLGPLHPDSSDEWDKDFLEGSLIAKIPGFEASYSISVLGSELKHWVLELEKLVTYKEKQIVLSTIEEYSSFTLKTLDFGRISWQIQLKYPIDASNFLSFNLENTVGDTNLVLSQLKIAISDLVN